MGRCRNPGFCASIRPFLQATTSLRSRGTGGFRLRGPGVGYGPPAGSKKQNGKWQNAGGVILRGELRMGWKEFEKQNLGKWLH